jgi:hypothetical protein
MELRWSVDANGQILSEAAAREHGRSINKEMPVPATVHYLVRPEGDVQESYLEWLKNDRMK